MAHERAELTSFNLRLGRPNDVVTITDVESHYTTSVAANAGIGYRCADCKVKVHAVIPEPIKKGRLRSPSSYFSSSPRKHRQGCTRLPPSVPPGGVTTTTMKARPAKAKVPTAWNDLPPAGTPTWGGNEVGRGAGASGTTTRGARVTASGGGTSKSDTGVVKRAAIAYLGMTTADLNATEFEATWNPGGTYATAFEVLVDGSITATPETEQRIYLGEVVSAFKGSSGYTVTLSPKHANGKELRLWLQNVIKTVPTGSQLGAALDGELIKPGMLAFALGAFKRQIANGGRVYYSMPLVDPRHMWFVESAEVGALIEEWAAGD